jgi:hypothetical protein
MLCIIVPDLAVQADLACSIPGRASCQEACLGCSKMKGSLAGPCSTTWRDSSLAVRAARRHVWVAP